MERGVVEAKQPALLAPQQYSSAQSEESDGRWLALAKDQHGRVLLKFLPFLERPRLVRLKQVEPSHALVYEASRDKVHNADCLQLQLSQTRAALSILHGRSYPWSKKTNQTKRIGIFFLRVSRPRMATNNPIDSMH